MPRNSPELASKAALYRTLPNTVSAAIAVTAVSATAAAALAPFVGHVVFLKAKGGDVTVLRGAQSVVAGAGVTILDGTYEEFYVAPEDASLDLSHIGSGACSLYILSDSEGN